MLDNNKQETPISPISQQMLELSQQLVLVQMVEWLNKYSQDGVEESELSSLREALVDCKLARRSKNPYEAADTFLAACELWVEWEASRGK